MKTYIANIIPEIQRFSDRLDNLTKLTNKHWVSLNDLSFGKSLFIFRKNNQLLVSENGLVKKGTWEYLGNQALLIEIGGSSFLFKQGFFDENILALKLDGENSYAFFINETKYDNELNNINDVLLFLEAKYLKNAKTEKLIDEKEQEKWFSDSNICPGCGFFVDENVSICPDCGLHLE